MAKANSGKNTVKATNKGGPRKAAAKPRPPAKAARPSKAKPAAAAKPKSAKAKPAAKAKAAPKSTVSAKRATPVLKRVARVAGSIARAVKEKIAPSTSSPAPGKRLAAGDTAPSFKLKDQNGNVVSSAELKGKPYVLYFYPKDDTPGCTREACGFRDAQAAFGKHGTRVIGVSPDSEASHAKFAGKYGLPFTLLSDPDKVLATAYGAWGLKKNYGREFMGIIRSTFVVGADGKVKRAYYGVKVDGHVDSVLGEVAS